jgi:diadenosine tetraphosphate (Ap4A) HIT family hydrolase
MTYDPANIFAKILRGEIPCKKVFENEHALAFHDIAPSAPVHVLVIPKGAYRHFDDFLARASENEITGFFRTVREVATQLGVNDAFRLITNNGKSVGQSVDHFHVHILGGRTLGALVAE